MLDVVEFPSRHRSYQPWTPTARQIGKLELRLIVVVDAEQIPWWRAQIHSHIYYISAFPCVP